MILTPSVFTGPDRPGDFTWMIDRPEWVDAVFVFNDNTEAFDAFTASVGAAGGLVRGAGNAAIRPYRALGIDRAAGFPTGSRRHGGWPALTGEVREYIDDAAFLLSRLCERVRPTRIVYSADPADGVTLGTGIFRVGDDVKAAILDELRRVTS
jgi:hypothetical protein